MEIIFPKEITILSNKLKIVQDKTHNSASFDLESCQLIIGVKSLESDPHYVFSLLSHEILECVYAIMNARYSSSRMTNHYLFSFDHQTFENANQIYCDTIKLFIK